MSIIKHPELAAAGAERVMGLETHDAVQEC
jgi:hypothetical protein